MNCNFISQNKIKCSYLVHINYIYYLLLMGFVSAVLIGALYLQIMVNELPCPLCLLQRVTYFGICFGIVLILRNGYSIRYEALIQLMTLILLVISTRQTLLDIYPRAGHEYIGSTILGIHMPVWSIIISLLLLFIYTIKHCLFGYPHYLENFNIYSHSSLSLKNIANCLIWLVIGLCFVNLLLVFLQCEFNACHTYGYQLLSFKQ